MGRLRVDAHHIANEIPSALPFVVACTLVMHITKGALYGIGSRTIRRQPQPLKARMGCSPLPHRFGFMHLVVIYHNLDPKLCSRFHRNTLIHRSIRGFLPLLRRHVNYSLP